MSERLPLAFPEQVKVLQGVLERTRAHADQSPRVLFDLDGTLIDNRPRSCAIFRELAREWQHRYPEHRERLSGAVADELVFSLQQNLRRLGVIAEEPAAEALEFWKARFFHDEFLVHDRPTPGAVEFVRACYDAGGTIIYFTGRALQNMALGTLRSLRDHGFPIGVPSVELVLKPDAAMHDFAYKKQTMARLARGSEVVAGFDNEPCNCNLFRASFPNACVCLLNTGHLPAAPELDSRVPVLADFRFE